MKQQSGSKRLSTFARYVVSYMLVLLLALSALFLYMYVYMNREVRAQVISNGINRLSRIAYQHEGYLDNMLNTAEQIGLSPYLQPFSYRDEPWRAYELMQQLVPYTVSNDFSDQMYLCFASDDYLYSSSSMMRQGKGSWRTSSTSWRMSSGQWGDWYRTWPERSTAYWPLTLR